MDKKLLVAALALAAISTPSWGDNLLALAVAGNQTFTPCTGDIDLSSAAGVQTVVNFVNPVAGPVTVTFCAECAVATSAAQWVGINIFVDPAPIIAGVGGDVLLPPTGAATALCSGDGTAVLTGWTYGCVTGVYNPLPAGIHQLRISKSPGGGATSCSLSDRSVVVTR